MIKLVISGRPITKKNHQRILMNFRTKQRFIGQSAAYEVYEKGALYELKEQYSGRPLDIPVNVKALYYMPTKGRCDIGNLIAATHDILTAAKVLTDDNSKIIVSVDGSRVLYDKNNPRVEIYIEAIND